MRFYLEEYDLARHNWNVFLNFYKSFNNRFIVALQETVFRKNYKYSKQFRNMFICKNVG